MELYQRLEHILGELRPVLSREATFRWFVLLVWDILRTSFPLSTWSDTMAQGFGQRVLSPQQTREAKILRRSVLQHFQNLPDPRVERTQHHSLVAIVTIAILAVLAGADGFVAIERYGKAKQSWLETFLYRIRVPYPRYLTGQPVGANGCLPWGIGGSQIGFRIRPTQGIPSHDTFGRVIGALDPQALEAGFLAWVGRITEVLGVELIHIGAFSFLPRSLLW